MAMTTSVTLLERITDGDEISWNQFMEIYSPLIRLVGGDWGLSASERDELVQDVMINFFKVSRNFRYDKERGRFRSYLRTIVRNCIFAIIKKRVRTASEQEEDEFSASVDCAFEEKWDSEWHNHLLGEALKVLSREMDPISYQAFHRYAIEGGEPSAVAAELGLSVNAVYVNKCRAMGRLRTIVKQLDTL